MNKTYLVIRYMPAVYQKRYIKVNTLEEGKDIAVATLKTFPESIKNICLVFKDMAYYYDRKGDLLLFEKTIPFTNFWLPENIVFDFANPITPEKAKNILKEYNEKNKKDFNL